MTPKLLAEWFWTDRWTGSRGFLLPMEARGLYREMLTQAWRRGARLPNDLAAIQRMVGISPREWRRSWPLVEPFWKVVEDALVNETQVDLYVQASRISNLRAEAGRRGGQQKASNRVANGYQTASKTPSKQPSKTLANDVANGWQNPSKTLASKNSTYPQEKEKLKQKEKESPQKADWFAECKRLHGGECKLNQQRHHLRMQLELARSAHD